MSKYYGEELTLDVQVDGSATIRVWFDAEKWTYREVRKLATRTQERFRHLIANHLGAPEDIMDGIIEEIARVPGVNAVQVTDLIHVGTIRVGRMAYLVPFDVGARDPRVGHGGQ